MKVLISIANFCLVLLAILGVAVTFLYCYYHYAVDDDTIGISYISDQIAVDVVSSDDLTEDEVNVYEERWFFEANYYSNDKGNGIELQELNLNYFTDYTLTESTYRSTGMQYVGDWTEDIYDVKVYNLDQVNSYVYTDFYYYDTTDHISWSGQNVSTLLNRSQAFIIKIDDQPYLLQLDKYYTTGWWIFGTTHYYTYAELFNSIFSAIKSNSAGYGDYYITIDLSTMFTIKAYDSASGKFLDDDVSDVVDTYAVLKFHYDENGARNSSQSLFGIIECNSNYDLDDDIDVSYWQERVVYNLTESSMIGDNNVFYYRYSEVYDGYFVSLSVYAKEFFVSLARTKVIIVIDLQSQFMLDNGYNVVGIDYNGFENFIIDTLQIISNAQTFYFLDYSLNNTNLQTLKYSAGLDLYFSATAINSEYLGVVV